MFCGGECISDPELRYTLWPFNFIDACLFEQNPNTTEQKQMFGL